MKTALGVVLAGVLVCAGMADGLTIDAGSIRKLTTGEDYLIDPWPGAFAFDGNRAAWIVWEWDGTFSLYCLDVAGGGDPSILETSTSLPYGIAVSGDKVLWDLVDSESGQASMLRLVDLSLPEGERTFDVHGPAGMDLKWYAIDGDCIAAVWTGDGQCYLETIDVANPAEPVNRPVLITDDYIRTVALHGVYVVWSVFPEEGFLGESRICVADTANDVSWEFDVPGCVDELDVNDEAIVGIAWYQMHRYDMFLIAGYTDVESARVNYFWRDLSVISFEPEIDGRTIVWRAENASDGCSEDANADPWRMCGYSLPGGVIRDDGSVAVSMLRHSGGFSPEIRGVHLSGRRIVWSEYAEDWILDLYMASLAASCPDEGLAAADLNADCIVDMVDAAIFASQWLTSTEPSNHMSQM